MCDVSDSLRYIIAVSQASLTMDIKFKDNISTIYIQEDILTDITQFFIPNIKTGLCKHSIVRRVP